MFDIRTRLLGVLVLLMLFINKPFAQEIQLNQEYVSLSSLDLLKTNHGDQYYIVLKFETIPNAEKYAAIARKGIQLLAYKGETSYLGSIPAHLDTQDLLGLGIRAIEVPNPLDKLSKKIQDQSFSSWARHESGKVDIALVFNTPFSKEEWLEFYIAYKADPINQLNKEGTIRTIRIFADQINELVQHPNIRWIEEVEPEVQRLNHQNTIVQSTNVLQSTAIGGYDLTGESVVIGVGDGGQLGEHIDLNCRVINEADGTYSSYGSHGDHVSGTIAGAGNLNPLGKGMAPEASLVIQKTTNIIYNTSDYIDEYGMVITNNSYGLGPDCDSNGSYNYSSINLDKQLRENEDLIHLFAAGNSGNDICNNYPQGYKTVLRYYGAAKNVLTVGAVDENREIANLSSRGPVADGRLKPEICGAGVNVESIGRDFNYFEISGTSMATPSVAGNIALLYQYYREQNKGENPSGALIKAITCNTADDLGNKGPDYTYGFGFLNAKRAVDVLAKRQYVTGTLHHAEYNSFPIEIPEGVAQVKVMLYWHDREAEVVTEQVLVNDLDLKVIAPNNISYRPWVLNPSPDEVMEEPSRGFDHLNNIEQVTFDNPDAGIYNVEIRGFQIPMGAQEFFVTYDFIFDDVELTYPFGKEKFVPSKKELIQWYAPDNNQDSFVLEYSKDSGLTWDLIAENIDATKRNYWWDVPELMLETGKVRISKTNGSSSDMNTEDFSILSIPRNFVVESPCKNRIELAWEAVPYEATYEVFLLECGEMESIGITAETNFVLLGNLEESERYWFAVRAISTNSKKSQRTIAESCLPNTEIDCVLINNEEPITSVQEAEENGLEATIYPNPFENTVHVNLKSSAPFSVERFEIIDVLSRNIRSKVEVKEIRPNEYILAFDLDVPSGVYYINIIKNQSHYAFPIVRK